MVFHGGGLDVAINKHGGEKSDWLDLSTGINPNPYPVYGVDPMSWNRLPDVNAMSILLNSARAYYRIGDGVDICAANGTQAIIDILPRAFDCKRVGIFTPTYNEHAHVWQKLGSEVVELEHGSVLAGNLNALVIVNPNNPDAKIYETSEVLKFASEMQKTGGIVIVDEAFCDTSPEKSIVPNLPSNVIVLKSFGKFFGLAGLRLGFAVGAPKLLEKLKKQIGPWAVSGPALQIGSRAFADTNWINYAITALEVLSSKQSKILGSCGFKIEGENPLFIYASHLNAQAIYEQLAECHILTRPFLQYPEKLRFGICANKEQLERFEKALKEVTLNV